MYSSFVFVFVDFTETQGSWACSTALLRLRYLIKTHTCSVTEKPFRSHLHSILKLSQPEKGLDLSLSRSRSRRLIIFVISWEFIQTTFRQSNKKFFYQFVQIAASVTNKKAQKMSEVEPLNENLNLTFVYMKSTTNSLLIKNCEKPSFVLLLL